MTKEALKLALEALSSGEDVQVGRVVWTEYDSSLVQEAITAIKEALAQPAQEPVEVDQATMELAESVGLIGPASRTHDLHQAIQRFHDLICVNATVKSAQMAADVIRESTPPQRKAQPEQEPCDMGDICIGCSPRNADGSCPSAQPQHKPLTESMIRAGIDELEAIRQTEFVGDYELIKRLLEAAHGIKE